MSATRQEEGQEWIVRHMRALGYPRFPAKVCFGYAHMALQAVLAQDFKRFQQRVQILLNNSPDILAACIKNLRAKLKDGSQLEEEIDKYILEIPAFLEAVQICQSPIDYQELFLQENTDQDFVQTLPLTISNQLKNDANNNIIKVAAFSGLYYNVSYLDAYFNTIVSSFNKGDAPPTLILQSSQHCILVTFSPEFDRWRLIDSEQPHYYNQLIASQEIGSEVFQALSNGFSEPIILSTHLYGLESTEESLVRQMKRWRDNKDWHSLHLVTRDKALARNFLGYSWLYSAVLNNEINTARQLLIFRQNLLEEKVCNKDLPISLLALAVARGFIEMATILIMYGANVGNALLGAIRVGSLKGYQGLVNAGVDINSAMKVSTDQGEIEATPLLLAIYWKSSAIINELLEHPSIQSSITKNLSAPKSFIQNRLQDIFGEKAMQLKIKQQDLLQYTKYNGDVSIPPEAFAKLLGLNAEAKLIASKLPKKPSFFQPIAAPSASLPKREVRLDK